MKEEEAKKLEAVDDTMSGVNQVNKAL